MGGHVPEAAVTDVPPDGFLARPDHRAGVQPSAFALSEGGEDIGHAEHGKLIVRWTAPDDVPLARIGLPPGYRTASECFPAVTCDPQTDRPPTPLTADGWYVDGPLSDMITRDGGNVSLAEAETLPGSHTAVRGTAVVAVDGAVYGQQFVAAVPPQDGDSFDTVDVLAHCRAGLPGHKVPSRVAPAEELLAAQPRASGSVS